MNRTILLFASIALVASATDKSTRMTELADDADIFAYPTAAIAETTSTSLRGRTSSMTALSGSVSSSSDSSSDSSSGSSVAEGLPITATANFVALGYGQGCLDNSPTTEVSCAQILALGQCDVELYPWMAGNCCATCFHCSSLCGTPTTSPTSSPTDAPTHTPTHAPTKHACNDGSHGCDTASTMCVSDGTNGFTCECIEGFVTDSSSTTSCAATDAPTDVPTDAPTQYETRTFYWNNWQNVELRPGGKFVAPNCNGGPSCTWEQEGNEIRISWASYGLHTVQIGDDGSTLGPRCSDGRSCIGVLVAPDM